jgi:chemotaxis protein methyltransferase CheR
VENPIKKSGGTEHGVDLDIGIDDFGCLSDFIYRKAGIRFEPKKLYFLSKRIQRRMQELGIDTPSEYIRSLRFSDPNGVEFQNLINLLTVNETYFFRDFPQLQSFAEHCLPELTARKSSRGDTVLRILSAGCSTGEEPYTLAIILLEMLDNIRQWQVEILACDIDLNVLGKARHAVYETRSLKDVPPEYLPRYFKEYPAGSYSLKNEAKRMVRFEHMNLAEKGMLRQQGTFDFIFCRNVLIYFDDLSRKQMVDRFYAALDPGGYIFLGSSESVGRITTGFGIKRAGGHLVYYKA